ncbi:hypothetical protein HNR72_007163 [Streptomyces collinus]|uniref:Uncharacterized protein n=1 Tax=Streptomyces collinus TaxID=42684 RepID=A0AA89QCI3_STRCU|nr:hypothetical protein [Streptomyces collinus]
MVAALGTGEPADRTGVDHQLAVTGLARCLADADQTAVEPFLYLQQDHVVLGIAHVPLFGDGRQAVGIGRGRGHEVAVAGAGVLLEDVPEDVVAAARVQGPDDGGKADGAPAEVGAAPERPVGVDEFDQRVQDPPALPLGNQALVQRERLGGLRRPGTTPAADGGVPAEPRVIEGVVKDVPDGGGEAAVLGRVGVTP